MADFLLHEGASVMCIHPPGQATPTSFSMRVKVSGRAVVTQPTLYSIAGCGLGASGSAALRHRLVDQRREQGQG